MFEIIALSLLCRNIERRKKESTAGGFLASNDNEFSRYHAIYGFSLHYNHNNSEQTP
jgi:hypothetical protein